MHVGRAKTLSLLHASMLRTWPDHVVTISAIDIGPPCYPPCSAMSFGQLVIGPPGAGKTTYCNGMQQYLGLLGRKVAVVNLDPANDALPYDCAVDVRDLVSLEEVQEETGLGPNGGASAR